MSINDMASRLARYWQPFNDRRVECTLCPRHCRPKQGSIGFCGVRGNVNNQMHTYNYGKSLAATEEVIETEAVNHYLPGARILSMGNIGCMMACSFCQNWETSQVKHLDQRIIRDYTPQDIIGICIENKIQVLSWTYNDPVVWHEFVVDTSRLARQYGIHTLYKSALYIEPAPLAELIDCIDIFSISLKSLSETFYKRVTRGRLGPVLDAIRQIAATQRHLEISQLIIPGLNDSEGDVQTTIDWVANNLGEQIPLHFVAFHPAYQYLHVARTGIDVLRRAKAMARQAGLRHVYLGNTFVEHENDTCCEHCGAVLVRRYGLHAELQQLAQDGRCLQCHTISPVRMPRISPQEALSDQFHDLKNKLYVHWDNEMQSVHVQQTLKLAARDNLRIRSLGPYPTQSRCLAGGLDRFILSRRGRDERGVVVSWDSANQYDVLPVLDRAHYPVSDLEQVNQLPVKIASA